MLKQRLGLRPLVLWLLVAVGLAMGGCDLRNPLKPKSSNTPQVSRTDFDQSGRLQAVSPEELTRFVQLVVSENATASKATYLTSDMMVAEAATAGSQTTQNASPITSTTTLQEQGVGEQDVIKVFANQKRLYSLFRQTVTTSASSQQQSVVPGVAVVGSAVSATSSAGTGETLVAEPDMGMVATDAMPYYSKQYQYGIRVMAFQDADATLTELQTSPLTHFAYEGLVLYNQKLVALGGNGGQVWENWFNPQAFYQQKTTVDVFNLTDTGLLEVGLNRMQFDGSLVASRTIGNQLYLVLRSTPALALSMTTANVQTIEPQDYLPKMQKNQQAAQLAVSPDQCYVNASSGALSLDVITLVSIDLSSEDYAMQSHCYLGQLEAVYASTKALYLATTKWSYRVSNQLADYDAGVTTEIHKFRFKPEGGFDYRATGTVAGHLGWQQNRKSFRMSEYQDYLRVITYDEPQQWFALPLAAEVAVSTDQGSAVSSSPVNEVTSASITNTADANSTARQNQPSPALLSILKEDSATQSLALVSKLPNAQHPQPLGLDRESLYATRFMGEQAFLVTFRVTDPLYVLNLADPTNPFIEGELKVDGYSDYLYPVGPGLLLGLGKDAKVDAAAQSDWRGGAWYQGVKLSLIDVSVPTNPLEVDKLIIGKRGSESAALWDHHAYTQLAVGQTTRIALPIEVHEKPMQNPYNAGSPSEWFDYSYTGLFKFEIDTVNKKLTQIGTPVVSYSATNGNNYAPYDVFPAPASRIINDHIHFMFNGQFWSQDWLGTSSVFANQ